MFGQRQRALEERVRKLEARPEVQADKGKHFVEAKTYRVDKDRTLSADGTPYYVAYDSPDRSSFAGRYGVAQARTIDELREKLMPKLVTLKVCEEV